jgi:hypothetical protein
MEAWLYPSDNIQGSAPSVRPSWWATMMADWKTTNSAWVSRNVVQGHLLNERLGGPGNDMRNLTPFAKSTNAQHHANVEKAAKAIKARNNILHYVVAVDYSSAPQPADFGNNIGHMYLKHFAQGITCTFEEYDGKTRKLMNTSNTITITNEI